MATVARAIQHRYAEGDAPLKWDDQTNVRWKVAIPGRGHFLHCVAGDCRWGRRGMKRDMAGRECHHCKQWVEENEAHDCWTTTEAALTKDLSEDLQDAYARLREAAVELGEQRIYATHHSIMFSRKACYFFVRPKRNFLELVIFLGRAIKAPRIRKVVESSTVRRAHLIHVRHRDEVEAPLTDWMREAYELQEQIKNAKLRIKNTTVREKPKKKTPAKAKKQRGLT